MTVKKDTKRGTWYYVIDGPPVAGKRQQIRKRGFALKKEAEAAEAQALVDIGAGVYVKPSKQTVADFLTEWIDTVRPTVRPSTWASYERNLRIHVTPRIGDLQLQHVDAGTISRLYSSLLADGHRGHGAGTKGLSPRTVSYIGTILHRALGDAVTWGRILRNPTDAVKRPKVPSASSTVKAWDADALGTFLRLSREYAGKGGHPDRYYPLWVLLATTGMRRGEALGVRWSDIDLDAGVLSISQTSIAVEHEQMMGTPKTAAGARGVELDAATVAALREHRLAQVQERLLMGAGFTDRGLVFCLPDGQPYHPERVSREFDRRVQRWALPRLTLHGLRHTWATLALRAGVHPKVVQERLGHSTIGITLGTYSHVSVGMQGEAAAKVAGLIFGT
jgi:integrase